MRDIRPQSEFYFVHSYHMVTSQSQDVLNETEYEYSFVSGVEKENIFGVQYHPEKSHDTGEQLLKNFLAI
jgi:glutamine amidotransferase